MISILDRKTDVRYLPLSTRAINCLIRAKIVTLEDLRSTFSPAFRRLRGLGRGTFEEISSLLQESQDYLKADPVDTLYRFLESLSERNRYILCSRCEITHTPFETLQQLGDRFGITRERVRQIEEKLSRKLAARFKHYHGLVLSSLHRTLGAEQVATISQLTSEIFPHATPEHMPLLRVILRSAGSKYIRLDTHLYATRNKTTLNYNRITMCARDVLLELGEDIGQISIEIGRRLSCRSPEEVSLIRKMLGLSPEFKLRGRLLSVAGESNLSMAMRRRNYAYEYIHEQGVPVNAREILYHLRQERPELLENIRTNAPHLLKSNLERDRRIAWAGLSTFALVEWGYDHNVRSIGDAAYGLLRSHGKPMRISEIQERILELYRVNTKSIASALKAEEGKRFRRTGKGSWTYR